MNILCPSTCNTGVEFFRDSAGSVSPGACWNNSHQIPHQLEVRRSFE